MLERRLIIAVHKPDLLVCFGVHKSSDGLPQHTEQGRSSGHDEQAETLQEAESKTFP